MSLFLRAWLRVLALGAAIVLGGQANAALAPDQLADVGVRPPGRAGLPWTPGSPTSAGGR